MSTIFYPQPKVFLFFDVVVTHTKRQVMLSWTAWIKLFLFLRPSPFSHCGTHLLTRNLFTPMSDCNRDEFYTNTHFNLILINQIITEMQPFLIKQSKTSTHTPAPIYCSLINVQLFHFFLYMPLLLLLLLYWPSPFLPYILYIFPNYNISSLHYYFILSNTSPVQSSKLSKF